MPAALNAVLGMSAAIALGLLASNSIPTRLSAPPSIGGMAPPATEPNPITGLSEASMITQAPPAWSAFGDADRFGTPHSAPQPDADMYAVDVAGSPELAQPREAVITLDIPAPPPAAAISNPPPPPPTTSAPTPPPLPYEIDDDSLTAGPAGTKITTTRTTTGQITTGPS